MSFDYYVYRIYILILKGCVLQQIKYKLVFQHAVVRTLKI